ncbi:MAG: hypothetical protein GY844_17335 [Bradyrhizobium sp.]|nr:hypothetical protein [Bradyrhizobium sp.]
MAARSLAADWSAKTSLSETVEANNNFFLTTAPKGNLYASTSAVFAELAARTPTWRYFVNGDFAYIRYLGPGAADTSLTTLTQNGLSLNAEYPGRQLGDKLSFVTSWRRQDTAAAQLNDIGIATTQGEMSTILAGGSFTKQLSAIDTLAFGATGSMVEFTGGNAQPYRNLTTGPTWTRSMNSITDWVSLGEFSWTVREDASRSETKFIRALSGFRLRPSSRLRVSASIGFGIVSGTGASGVANTFGSPVAGFGTVQPGNEGTVAGWLADAQVTYKLLNDVELSANASRSITPGVLGFLSLRTSYGLGVSHTINASSSISLRGEMTRSSDFGASSDYWTASAAYEKRLTREWRTNLSYVYRQRTSDVQSVSSNAVIVVLARDVVLLP